MSTPWGKALDQANIVRASFNDLDRSVIKGTRHKLRIPKEKHVRKLVIYTHERLGPIGDLYTSLLKRMEQPDWIIVLKTLIVFHRILAGGNVRFLEDLTHRGNVFPLARFTDMTSTQAHQQSVFIRRYSAYLEEKVFAYREMKQEFDKDTFTSKGLSIEQLLNRIPKMQRQFDALLATHVEEVCDNIITINAFELLLKDSFKMYCNLNDAVLNILELYFNMTKRDATKALDIYKVFMRETDAIIEFFSSSRRKFHIDLPELARAPSTVVQGLEEYLRDLEDDGLPPHPVYNNSFGNKTGSNNGRSSIGSNSGLSYNNNNTYSNGGSSTTNSGGRNNNNYSNNNNNNNNSKRNEELISFDDDLFSTPPPQIQQQPQQSFNKPAPTAASPFELDPFHVTNIPQQQTQQQQQQIQMQPFTFSSNNNNNNSHQSVGSVNPSNYHNPFDPAYNEKALQIKAAFQSSQGDGGVITNRNSLNLNDLSFSNNSNSNISSNNSALVPLSISNNNNNNSMNNGMAMNMQQPMNNGMGMQQPMNNGMAMNNNMMINNGMNNNMMMNNGMKSPNTLVPMQQQQQQPNRGMQQPMNNMMMNNGMGMNMQQPMNNNNNNNNNMMMNNGIGMQQPMNNGMGMNNNNMMRPMGMQQPMNNGMGMQQPINNGMGMHQPINNGMGMQQPMNNGMGMHQPMNNGMGMNNNNMMRPNQMGNNQNQQQNQQVQNIYF